ncbi:MAG: NAD(P)H-hydrate dehydratase [Firmicutes bacterium]|nr:NAD(P)H-hydrate dehydratase [Bacillota bacterium]
MTWLTTGKQMRQIDRRAIEELQVPGALLMEAAAVFTANVASEHCRRGGNVAVICGSGNNGGDGWGAARHLAARGYSVMVYTACDPETLEGDARLQHQLYVAYDLPWSRYRGPADLTQADLIVDALLGTGVRGAPRDDAAAIIRDINDSDVPVLAVDIPSGLPAEAVPAPGVVVRASATASFGLAKLGLYANGCQYAGKVYVDPIGLPAHFLRDTGIILNDKENARRGFPERRIDSHKGTYGHALLVAGSRGMSGAAMLAGTAALKSGIGLLTVACPRSLNEVLESNLWEALTLPLPETEAGTFAPEAAAAIQGGMSRYRAAAVGPGLGQRPEAKALVTTLLDSGLPLVVDADGLNLLAGELPERKATLVISPHPGEMARLLGNTIEQVLAEPLAIARAAARRWRCVVILKGATSYIAEPAGSVAVNISGTDGLATGGAGDVLTGLILGLLCQGSDPFAAACTAAWLLGRSSELAADQLGTASQLPRDVLAHLPRAVCQLTGQ